MTLPPEAQLLAAVCAVIFTAALVSSIAGFAFSALSGAALLYLFGDPVRTVSVIVACSIAIQAYSVWKLRHDIEWRLLRKFLPAGAAMVPLGVCLLALTPPAVYAAGLGIFLIAYGLYAMLRSRAPVLQGGPRADAAAGALAGLAGGLAGFPGSFMTIWCGMRGWTKERQRGVYQPFILAMQLEALACLGLRAPASITLETFVLYVPLALVAACIGMAIYRRMTSRQFSATVNALLLVSGLVLVGRAL